MALLNMLNLLKSYWPTIYLNYFMAEMLKSAIFLGDKTEL